MVKLEILNIIDNYKYELIDEENQRHYYDLNFFDIEQLPRLGDYIYIHEKLLDPFYEGYSNCYNFGDLDNKYGRKGTLLKDIDIIKVIINNREVYLKRLYG